MRIISSEATIDDAFEVAQLMIEEGNTEHGVQLLHAAEIALVRAEGDRRSCHVVEIWMQVRRVPQLRSRCGNDFTPRLHGRRPEGSVCSC